jgi:hypothetical protein
MESGSIQARPTMQMLHSRTVRFVDSDTLAEREAREALFRGENGFILYLSGGELSSSGEERVLFLELREALLWLNEPAQECGSFWQ